MADRFTVSARVRCFPALNCPGVTNYSQVASSGGDEARLGGASGGCGWFACSTPALGGTSTTATGFTSFTSIPLVAGANSTGWGNSGIGGIHEDSQLQFRVEFHNMLNHPQFTSPGSATPVTTGYNAGTFGQIGSTSVNPRLIQLALKYVF